MRLIAKSPIYIGELYLTRQQLGI
ncbi:hypothetical protein [Cytobacillus horneckiae]